MVPSSKEKSTLDVIVDHQLFIHTVFTISFVLSRRKTLVQVWNNLRVSKWLTCMWKQQYFRCIHFFINSEHDHTVCCCLCRMLVHSEKFELSLLLVLLIHSGRGDWHLMCLCVQELSVFLSVSLFISGCARAAVQGSLDLRTRKFKSKCCLLHLSICFSNRLSSVGSCVSVSGRSTMDAWLVHHKTHTLTRLRCMYFDCGETRAPGAIVSVS